MKKLLRIIATAMLGVGLSAGVVAAQSGSIDTTGPDSNNQIKFKEDVDVDVDQKNEVDVDNDTDQTATTGDATVKHNTEGGDATSGDASNDSRVSTSATLLNSLGGSWGGGGGSHSATINKTGPDSNNQIEFRSNVDVDVDQRNEVDVDNDVDQTARSGDAEVKDNTTGGDATSGDASNTSHTTTTVNLSNN